MNPSTTPQTPLLAAEQIPWDACRVAGIDWNETWELAIRYVQFGRFGLLALILLLRFGDRALDVWMSPVGWAVNGAETALSAYRLPSTDQWLR